MKKLVKIKNIIGYFITVAYIANPRITSYAIYLINLIFINFIVSKVIFQVKEVERHFGLADFIIITATILLSVEFVMYLNRKKSIRSGCLEFVFRRNTINMWMCKKNNTMSIRKNMVRDATKLLEILKEKEITKFSFVTHEIVLRYFLAKFIGYKKTEIDDVFEKIRNEKVAIEGMTIAFSKKKKNPLLFFNNDIKPFKMKLEDYDFFKVTVDTSLCKLKLK